MAVADIGIVSSVGNLTIAAELAPPLAADSVLSIRKSRSSLELDLSALA